jgi:hypothetical protein
MPGSLRYRSPPQACPADGQAELLLVVAVLHRAQKDLTSPREAVRAEAAAFWGDGQAVAFWSDLLDCDAAQLVRAVQRAAP